MEKDQSTTTIATREQEELQSLLLSLRRVINPPGRDQLWRFAILANFAVLYVRPQNNLPILSSLFLTVALFSVCGLLWLTHSGKNWTRQTGWMLGFIALHTVFIVIGKSLYDPLIVNDGVAYKTWSTLVQLFICFLFPLIAFFPFGKSIRRLIAVIVIIVAYLAFYGIMHAGYGPGDFLEDENDLCAVLVMFLPFVFLSLFTQRTFFRRLSLTAITLLVIAGIVTSGSRGGFLGLIACLVYMIIKSPYPGRILASLIIVGGLSFPFIPSNYWKEMSTITNVSEGTAQTRRDYWKVATKVFLDPRNTLTGVGLNNTPWVVQNYEKPEGGYVNWSMGGRQMHSLYFQLLPDLGLLGVLFFWMIVGRSYLDNRRLIRQIGRLLDMRAFSSTSTLTGNSVQFGRDKPADRSNQELLGSLSSAVWTLREELRYAHWMLTALNAAWIGLLVSAAFISVLYYPHVWFLASLSAIFALYLKQLQPIAEAIARGSVMLFPQASIPPKSPYDEPVTVH